MSSSPPPEIKGIQVMLKDDGYATALVKYIKTIINQNRLTVTEEERKNPVIFKKEVQNYITLKMSIAKNKESAKVLSGGNFDFDDSTGEGYHLTIKYTDYDDVVKTVIKTIRESNFACLPSRTSTTCFMNRASQSDDERDSILKELCSKIERLNKQQEKQQPFKTPEQISDEDYKVAPTSADNIGSVANNNNGRSFPEWRNLYNVDEKGIEKLPWYSKELDADLKKELEDRRIKNGGKFLDLGTGPATQAIALSKLGFDVTGTDVSESAIERAKKLSKDINFVVDDILNSKLEDNQFDYIFDRGCFHVLEPKDRPHYVSKVKSLLNSNGMLFLKTFSTQEPRTYGPHHFSPEMIRQLFSNNFEILTSKETVFQGTLQILPKALFTVMRKR
jgi:SAM-dependent methyltransferase